MGFELNRKYHLQFEGDLKGLEITLKATSIATTLALTGATSLQFVAETLSAHLIEWNFEKDGKPLGTSAEEILDLEEAVLFLIVREWIKAAKGVTAPLDDGSTSGDDSPELSIPMETP